MLSRRATSLVSAVALLLITAGGLPSQILTVQGTGAPGSTLLVTIFNNTANPVIGPVGDYAFLMDASGEMVTPDYVNYTDVVAGVWPGTQHQANFVLPSTGPGSAGSYVMYTYLGQGAGARVDVGAPTPGFPSIHAFPSHIFFGFEGRLFPMFYPPSIFGTTGWQLVNVGTAPHTFATGDVVEIHTPGGSTPLTTTSLAGITIPPNSGARVPLPLANLNPGPYTVETRWVDPVAGSRMLRQGIEYQAVFATPVAVGLPGGRTVALNGTLPVRIQDAIVITASAPAYLLLVGVAPGQTTLPGGAIVPLVADPVVIASAANGLGGLVGSFSGMLTSVGQSAGAFGLQRWQTNAPRLHHPNVPSLSGLTLRIAAVTLRNGTDWAASQPEEIVLQ